MNTIEGKVAIGAPHSKARFEQANRICADCLEGSVHVFGRIIDSGDWKPFPMPYKALSIGSDFASYDGRCYVCEKQAHVAVVECNYSRCPACGYFAFNGVECFDCGYRPRVD